MGLPPDRVPIGFAQVAIEPAYTVCELDRVPYDLVCWLAERDHVVLQRAHSLRGGARSLAASDGPATRPGARSCLLDRGS